MQIIIVARSTEGSVLNEFTRKFSADLKSLCANKWTVQSIYGYWELKVRAKLKLTLQSVYACVKNKGGGIYAAIVYQ